ncbi:Hypothetical predicted protein, partial [Pelobates cultripes]
DNVDFFHQYVSAGKYTGPPEGLPQHCMVFTRTSDLRSGPHPPLRAPTHRSGYKSLTVVHVVLCGEVTDAARQNVHVSFAGPLGCHLKVEVKEKIWKGEFVEIFSLLPLEEFLDLKEEDKKDAKKEEEEKRRRWLRRRRSREVVRTGLITGMKGGSLRHVVLCGEVTDAARQNVHVSFAGPLGCHLKVEVKEKIWKGEFVEIFSLLPLEEFLDLKEEDKKDAKKEEEEKRRRK